MKFAILASVALLAVAHAETCDYAVVGPSLQSLGQPIASCMTATDNSYNLARATEPPTEEQAAAICAKCSDFVDAVSKLTWPDCTMNVGGKNQTLTEYFDAMVGGCKSGGSAAATTAPETTTVAPATATASTNATATGSSSDASATSDSSVVTTAPVTSSSPVPSPSSAGYSITVGVFAASAIATSMAVAL